MSQEFVIEITILNTGGPEEATVDEVVVKHERCMSAMMSKRLMRSTTTAV